MARTACEGPLDSEGLGGESSQLTPPCSRWRSEPDEHGQCYGVLRSLLAPEDLRRYTPSGGLERPGRSTTPSPDATFGSLTLDLRHAVTLRAGKVHTGTMVGTKSDDIGSDDSGRLYETEPGEQGQDPISSLHDTDEETGDEAGLIDTLAIDSLEAKELGVQLDSPDGQEPELD